MMAFINPIYFQNLIILSVINYVLITPKYDHFRLEMPLTFLFVCMANIKWGFSIVTI